MILLALVALAVRGLWWIGGHPTRRVRRAIDKVYDEVSWERDLLQLRQMLYRLNEFEKYHTVATRNPLR